MLTLSKRRLAAALLVSFLLFFSLWGWLAIPGPKISPKQTPNPLPYIFSGKGAKLLGIGEESRRRTAYFDFSSSRTEAHKSGITGQRLQNIHGYIQTRIDEVNHSQEIYYFSSPLGHYLPEQGELTMQKSHFTLAHLPEHVPKEHLFQKAPMMEGAADKTKISLEKGAEITTRRVRAIIYDTKGLKKNHE